jgi:tetratricopeptide (TPR) repeat protein
MVALIVVLLFPAVRPGGSDPGFTGGIGPVPMGLNGGGEMTGRAAPLTGTPREQADRLFHRVMQAQAQGDSDQVAFFLPMAVLAYRQAGTLDADGLYPLSVLEPAAGDPTSGLASAREILATAPDHLLALAAAAQAADALEERAAAKRYYEHFLEVLPAERGKPLREYMDHEPIFRAYQEEAEAYLGR